MNPKPAPRKERASFIQNRRAHREHTGSDPLCYNIAISRFFISLKAGRLQT